MGLAAYTLGERDLALGIDNLKQLAVRAKFPILAANLVDAKDEPVFSGSAIVGLGAMKVGVIGLLGERTAVPKPVLSAAGLRLIPPAEVAAKEAKRLTKEGTDLLVVLSHLGHGEERAVAVAAPEIQFFVGSHTGRRLASAVEIQRPEGSPPAYWVEAGSRGKYVGRLEIYPARDSDDLTHFVDAGARRGREESLTKRERNLSSSRARLAELTAQVPEAGQETRHKARVEATQRSIDRLEQQIAAERSQLSAPPPSVAGRPVFVNHVDPMELSIVEREDIREAVAALQATGLLAPIPRKLPPHRTKPVPATQSAKRK